MPRRVDPVFAAGAQVISGEEHDFLNPKFRSDLSSSNQGVGVTAFEYTHQTDLWFIDLTVETGGAEWIVTTEAGEEGATHERTIDSERIIPPMAYDPNSESAREEEFFAEDEWVYPNVPDDLKYERFFFTSIGTWQVVLGAWNCLHNLPSPWNPWLRKLWFHRKP